LPKILMGARSDFWLHIHNLAQCLEQEGSTPAERREAILASLRDLPPIAQSEVAGELEVVYDQLRALRRHVTGEQPVRLPPR
jgi:hypothetical protein